MAGGNPRRAETDGPEASAEQRERIVAAIAKTAAEHGYARFSVERALRYAGLPRTAFDAHFESKEQGLLAAQDAFLERLWLDAVCACESLGQWPLKVRAALTAILSSLAEANSLARVFAVEAAADLAIAERQFAALDRFAGLLSEGRQAFPEAASLPEATERTLVGGIASIVSGHLLMEDPQAISALEDQLVELTLIPYIGVAEARRVAAS